MDQSAQNVRFVPEADMAQAQAGRAILATGQRIRILALDKE
jgi:hypothetical protein